MGAVVVVGTETLTRIVDPDDRATVPLFGDGAAAVVLRPALDDQGRLHKNPDDVHPSRCCAGEISIDGAGVELVVVPHLPGPLSRPLVIDPRHK